MADPGISPPKRISTKVTSVITVSTDQRKVSLVLNVKNETGEPLELSEQYFIKAPGAKTPKTSLGEGFARQDIENGMPVGVVVELDRVKPHIVIGTDKSQEFSIEFERDKDEEIENLRLVPHRLEPQKVYRGIPLHHEFTLTFIFCKPKGWRKNPLKWNRLVQTNTAGVRVVRPRGFFPKLKSVFTFAGNAVKGRTERSLQPITMTPESEDAVNITWGWLYDYPNMWVGVIAAVIVAIAKWGLPKLWSLVWEYLKS